MRIKFLFRAICIDFRGFQRSVIHPKRLKYLIIAFAFIFVPILS
jgi:hypothetical protein